MRLRQCHSDGSQSLLIQSSDKWNLSLVLPKKDGSWSTLVGVATGDCDVAKMLSRRAMEREHYHLCTEHCQDWETF